MSTPILLHLHGLLRIERDGAPVAGLSRRGQGLVAYLACQPGMRAERGFIADLLWSDRAEEQARASLRQELSVLRRHLPGIVGANRQHVWLDSDRVTLAPGQGELLQGFDLPSEGFEDWLRAARQRGADVPSAPEVTSTITARDRPMLAVLPFDELGAAQDDMFADGVVEEITGALSRVHDFHVIARQSAFALPGGPVSATQAASVLGADYVVEGSVRRAGERVRISVQLVAGEDGRTLWTERFDDRLDDLFDLQDRIAQKVAGQLSPSLRAAEIARARSHAPEDRSVYELYLTALPKFWISTKPAIEEAIALLDTALARDADYVPALAFKAWAHASLAAYMWSTTPEAEFDRALTLANHAAALAGDHAPSLVAVSGAYAFCAEDAALGRDFALRALAIDPNNAWGWMRLGWARFYEGDLDGVLTAIDRAESLSPLDPFRFNMMLARAAAMRERGAITEAIALTREAMRAKPDLTWARRTLIGTLLAGGLDDEAAEEMKRLMADHPDVTPEMFLQASPRALRQGSHGQVYLDRFQSLGMSALRFGPKG